MSNPQAAADESHVLIKVSHSLLTPVLAPPLQPAYLLLGTTASTAPAKTIVSIAPNHGSYALVPQESAVEVDVAPGNESQFLSQLAHLLRVENLLSICRRDSTLLIHQPPQEMASSIVAAAASRNVAVFFTTSSAPATDDGPWIAIDSYAQRREIQSLLPPDVTVFIDGSNSKDAPAKRLGAVISSSLPDPCLRTTLAGIHELQHARDFTAADLRSRLNSAVHSALKNSALSDGSGLTLPTITLDQLLAGEQAEVDVGEPAVLDWGSGSSSPAKVPVQVPTVESLVRFRSDKTYVMFGLTSDLAQSTCSWMASLGARNIVLTSRNPKVDERWLKVMRDAGVRLEVFAK
jgi:hybrid polyketide synthase/nonribosomal peptide synthetase ACE1